MLRNIPIIVRMGFHGELLKFFFRLIKKFYRDPAFSFFKLMKTMLNSIKGEKIVYFNRKFIVSSFLPPLPSQAFEQLTEAVPEPVNIYTQQMLAQRSAPISCFLCLTNDCQLNCLHCSAARRKNDNSLSTAEWTSVINDLQEMGTGIIGFTGGEPLLRDDLEEIISAVDERSISILYTNGAGLSKERAVRLKECGLFGAGISLDSHLAEKHNGFRRNPRSFDLAVQAVKYAKRAGLYTFVQLVCEKSVLNYEYLKNYIQFVKKLGVNEVRILEPIICGELYQKDDQDAYFYLPEDRNFLKKIQYSMNRKMGYPKITTFAHTESSNQYGCGAGTQHSYISASGDLYPCDFVPLGFGNVKQTSIKQLWLEMNRIIGIPKTECFAMQLKEILKNKGDLQFPLAKKESEQIFSSHRSSCYPKFYQLLQGNDQKNYQ